LNILWALPTHLLYFFRNKRAEWTSLYFMITGFLAIGILVFWKWLPQEMPIPAIPLILLVVVKSLGRRYWKKTLPETQA
jgi:MFS superfamily sulfate permease-like transporter